MQIDTAEAAQMIVAEVTGGMPAGGGGEGAAAAAVPAELMSAINARDFCGIWVQAKPILQLVANLGVLIPGVGAVAGTVLRGLIQIGDQIYSAQCGK